MWQLSAKFRSDQSSDQWQSSNISLATL
jgi:hypothetical protein